MDLSGYRPYTEVLAQRARHGDNRTNYVISLPLHLIGTYLPIPDPEVPFPGNRRVNKRHAEQFGEYWRERNDWVAPPLLVDTTLALHEHFEPKFRAGGVDFGVLQLHQNSASDFDILDGQHRILGWKLVGEQIANELKSLRSKLQVARENQDDASIAMWEQRIAEAQRSQERFNTEYVTIEIMQGLSEEDHKQAFNDIATNARGITKSVTVSFDRRSMINRIAVDLAQTNDLVGDRIDWEKDRVVGRNENVLSGRNLADIVRHVALGIDGRMTVRRESEMSEGSIAYLVDKFFETLVSGFPQLRAVQEDQLAVSELREREMTLSPTVLRVLAGAFHVLAVDLSDERNPALMHEGAERALKLFSQLSEHMSFPLDEAWYATGYFAEDSKAPSSRAQDLKGLTQLMVDWAHRGEIFS